MAQLTPARTAPLTGTTPVARRDAGLLRFLNDEERAALRLRDFARANRILTERLGLKARILTAEEGAR